MRISVVICLSFICTLVLSAQQSAIRKGDRYFSQNAFSKAIPMYLSAIEKGSTDKMLYGKLADAYFYSQDAKNACDNYQKLISEPDSTVDIGYYFRYVKALRSMGENLMAEELMRRVVTIAPNDGRSLRYLNKREMEEWNDEPFEVELTNLPFNSDMSEYASFINNNQLLFVSNRDKLKDNEYWIGKRYASLFYTSKNGKGRVERFPIKTEPNLIDDSGVSSRDGKTLYLTRSNIVEKGLINRKRTYSTFKIFRFVREGKKWSKPISLPINSDNYNVANPALDPQGTFLYFVSDMAGGFGKSDIYKAPINTDGSIGVPVNLGNQINTEERETYIYIDGNNHLYFASDGHWGYGGLDIYMVNLSDSVWQPLNMGQPINSARDDFSFVKDSKDAGFLSSNRDGGVGADDIYAFRIWEKRHTTIKGTVLNSKDNSPLNNANVILYGGNNVLPDSVKADSEGHFEFDSVLWLWHTQTPLQRRTIKAEHPLFGTVTQAILLRGSPVLELAKPLKLEPNKRFLTYQIRVVDASNGKNIAAKLHYLNVVEPVRLTISDTISKQYSFVASPNITVEVSSDLYHSTKRFLSDSLANDGGLIEVDFALNPIDVGDKVVWKNVLFETAKWDILPQGFGVLDKLSDYLKNNSHISIDISGHTDSRGSYNYNLLLSEKRAKSVADYLINRGISKTRISSKGYSFSIPVASNETPEGQLLNRRVEFDINKE